jgi:hypothetical protein
VRVDNPASEPSSGARLLLAGGLGAAIAKCRLYSDT